MHGKKHGKRRPKLLIFDQVKHEKVKVLTVTVIRATGVKVPGFQFGDCKFLISTKRVREFYKGYQTRENNIKFTSLCINFFFLLFRDTRSLCGSQSSN